MDDKLKNKIKGTLNALMANLYAPILKSEKDIEGWGKYVDGIIKELDSCGKSQKLRDCIGKTIWIEGKSGQGFSGEGKVMNVDDNWITILWTSPSPVENKKDIFYIAIDSIESFRLVEDKKPKIKVDLPEFDQEGLKEKIEETVKNSIQTMRDRELILQEKARIEHAKKTGKY